MSTARRILAGFAIGAAVGALVALPFTLASASGITTVSQIGRAFAVASIHIHRGDTVHFTNDDKFDHQLVVDSPSFHFESHEQPPGTSEDIVFTKAGSFDVGCEIHPRMHLAVTVD